jgi:hypothetical protein
LQRLSFSFGIIFAMCYGPEVALFGDLFDPACATPESRSSINSLESSRAGPHHRDLSDRGEWKSALISLRLCGVCGTGQRRIGGGNQGHGTFEPARMPPAAA